MTNPPHLRSKTSISGFHTIPKPKTAPPPPPSHFFPKLAHTPKNSVLPRRFPFSKFTQTAKQSSPPRIPTPGETREELLASHYPSRRVKESPATHSPKKPHFRSSSLTPGPAASLSFHVISVARLPSNASKPPLPELLKGRNRSLHNPGDSNPSHVLHSHPTRSSSSSSLPAPRAL